MTSCCQPHPMPWNGATDAIVRCKGVSTACGRKSRSVRVWHWICGVKRTPKAVNKPLPPFIVHELDKPGSSATVSDSVPAKYATNAVGLEDSPITHAGAFVERHCGGQAAPLYRGCASKRGWLSRTV